MRLLSDAMWDPERLRRAGRRAWLAAVAAAVSAPLCASLLRSASDDGAAQEHRALASVPALPRNLDALTRWPRQVEAYVGDHFGLRDWMISLRADITQGLLHNGTA